METIHCQNASQVCANCQADIDRSEDCHQQDEDKWVFNMSFTGFDPMFLLHNKFLHALISAIRTQLETNE